MSVVLLILPLVLLAGPPLATQSYSCGPFLLQPGPTRMTVVIDHEHPVAATLTYRLEGGKEKEKEIRHAEPRRHHIFTLEGLKPDAEYRYQIKSGGDFASGKRHFLTLPEAPTKYRLIALGDVRSQPHMWKQVSERIFSVEKDALFIIGTGDYPVEGSKYHQWIEQFFEPARNLLSRMPIWPAIGNHEGTRQSGDPREEESHFFSLFELPGNERWYRVDYGYTTLLIIDSNSSMEPGSEQYEWLRGELRSQRKRFSLVAFHHPPLTSGPHGSLNPDGTPREWPMDQGQRFLVPLFEMYGVDLVLNGHDHLYERSQKNGVYYVITGGGGAPLYKINSVENRYQQIALSVNHYVAIDVENTAITLTAIAIDGNIIDWFKIPLAAEAVARKRHFIADKLQRALHVGAINTAGKEVELTIENVLDFPLRIRLSTPTKKQGDHAPFSLQPGASRQIPLALESYFPAKERPAWRGGIYADLKVAFVGDDAGLPIDIEVEHELTLVEPSYEVAQMRPPQIDGRLEEWRDLVPMRIDSQSPLIVKPSAYRGDEDLQALVRLGWSPQELHVAIQVQDDEVMDDLTQPIWLTDSIELFWDGRPEAERSAGYGEWVSHNIFPVKRAVEGRFLGRGSWEVDALEWKVEIHEDGYVLEASIPYGLIKEAGTTQPGDQVRFDLRINDQDSRDQEESHHKLWSRDRISRDPSGYGFLKLK